MTLEGTSMCTGKNLTLKENLLKNLTMIFLPMLKQILYSHMAAWDPVWQKGDFCRNFYITQSKIAKWYFWIEINWRSILNSYQIFPSFQEILYFIFGGFSYFFVLRSILICTVKNLHVFSSQNKCLFWGRWSTKFHF